MADLKSRLKPAFRRPASSSSVKPAFTPTSPTSTGPDLSWARNSLRLGKPKKTAAIAPVQEEKEQELPTLPSSKSSSKPSPPIPDYLRANNVTPPEQGKPRLLVEQASPDDRGRSAVANNEKKPEDPSRLGETDARINASARPNLATRRHSPISFDRSDLFWLQTRDSSPVRTLERATTHRHRSPAYNMQNRKIWVKRPNATATKVTITEDDLVDDVKDMVLRKYANSLGRNFDPPDMSLKVIVGPHSSRHTNERTLAPDENISKILDLHYPGGQSIDEALLIDVPQRRTPKHSPRVALPYYVNDDIRPAETSTDYFPPMPVVGPQSPLVTSNMAAVNGQAVVPRPPSTAHSVPHSIAVLETGHLPNLPSPGAPGRARHSERNARPRYGRQHTASPVITGASLPTNHGRKYHANFHVDMKLISRLRAS